MTLRPARDEHNLADTIRLVEERLATAEASCGNYASDPTGYHQRRRQAMRDLMAILAGEIGAAVNDRWDGARVRIAGISASSTSGIGGALRNWLAAARKQEPAA